ncbi:hypothetical protein DFP72DRAFT_1165865 [Ephemerocybe angulata]|uniref:DUF7923 domain-containing protein n=1 Tax=Ephemerocybe angulata TaxID=980116 RepID=A0A8H6I8A6_9AGAR|nr:hypothetical protein DFP72DRAFT_1165865 [Tulosesus angulatus]
MLDTKTPHTDRDLGGLDNVDQVTRSVVEQPVEPKLQGDEESPTTHGYYNSDGALEGELSDVISNLNLNDEEKNMPQEEQAELCGRSDASQKELERRLVAEKKMAELRKWLADAQARNGRLNRELMETKRLYVLELRKTGHQILVLIDADGSVFNPRLIQLGRKGGKIAADKLIAGVQDNLPDDLVMGESITAFAFLCFERVCKRLIDNGFRKAAGSFREFVKGFTGAQPGFSMIHVNAKKDEADEKIKHHLQKAMESRDIYKVYFAGCHDHGYLPALQKYAKLPHLRDKLILLRARSDTSRGYNDLMKSLRPMRITELFHPDNIPNVRPKPAKEPSSHTTGQEASSAPGTDPTGALSQVPASHSIQVPPHGASATVINSQDDTGTTCASISQPQSASPGEETRTYNRAFEFSSAPAPVVVAFGGTSGIGEAIVRLFATLTKGRVRIIIVGRNKERAEGIIASLPQPPEEDQSVQPGPDTILPKAGYTFLPCDVTLMGNIHALFQTLTNDMGIAHIDYLVLSAGVLGFGGREDTSEGLDVKLASRFYSRWKILEESIPLLEAARSVAQSTEAGRLRGAPGVLSVLGAGHFMGRVDYEDIGMKQGYKGWKAVVQSIAYNDLMVQAFAKRYPDISFTHAYPGAVDSGMLRFEGNLRVLNILTQLLLRPLIRVVMTSTGDCAEWMVYSLLSGSKEVDGVAGGMFRRNNRGEDIGMDAFPNVEEEEEKLFFEHCMDAVSVRGPREIGSP